MRILLDHCVPRRLRDFFPAGHEITTVYEMGWAHLKDKPLLHAAQDAFDVLLTTDRNLRFQQHLPQHSIAVFVLLSPTNRLNDLLVMIPKVAQELDMARAGAFVEIGGAP